LLVVTQPPHHRPLPSRIASQRRNHRPKKLATDFCNKIDPKRTCAPPRCRLTIRCQRSRPCYTVCTRVIAARQPIPIHSLAEPCWKFAQSGHQFWRETFSVSAMCSPCDSRQLGRPLQEAGMISLTLRADNDSGVGNLLQTRIKAPIGSKERQEADKQIDKIDQVKSKRTPDDRHRLRMKALYVDILSEEHWNRPVREISQTAAYEFLADDINDYRLQRSQRYMELQVLNAVDSELHDALVQWSDRPELPHVEAPSYPAA